MTDDECHSKKYQRRIVKMMENMMVAASREMIAMDDDEELKVNEMEHVELDGVMELNYIDPYTQSLFECVTKHVLKRTVWINKESERLSPLLKTVFINDFVPFLKRSHGINSKYAHTDSWTVNKEHLLMTDRQRPLKSKQYNHVEIWHRDDTLNAAEENTEHEEGQEVVSQDVMRKESEPMSLKEFRRLKAKKEVEVTVTDEDVLVTVGFRCYQKYDALKKKQMFKGEFYVLDLPPQIESVKLLGGIWFPQIPLSKWDWCCFSKQKTSNESHPIIADNQSQPFPLPIQ